MICVTLGRTRHSAFQEGHQLLAEQKAELVELRLDWLRRKPDVGRLLKDRPTKVVITCRRQEDQGRWRLDEDTRLAVLREAIIGGAEFVDLEVDIAKKVPRYGKTKRIISYHNFNETPIELPAIYKKLAQGDPDVIKLVTMAKTPADNVRVLEVMKNSQFPIVAFCMGEYGVVSRILCRQHRAPFTYAGFSGKREMAPGQPTFAEVRNLYRFNKINKQTKSFGVIGDPIEHSLSPLLHNAAFRKIDFNGVYLPMKIPAEVLEDTIKQYNRLGLKGYSVTIPHKEAALEIADVPDAQADAIGAANTLYLKDDQWHATNTDYYAIMETIKAAMETHDRDPETISKQRVLILGAGGVARAAVAALQTMGAVVSVTNRTRDRAKELAKEFDCRTVDWANRGADHCEVLINCTSVGMHPNVDESPYEQHWLKESMLIFDTVYTPENTLLLKHAKLRGCAWASGIDMFVRQAALQFKLFTGEDAPLEYMTETLRRSLSATR